MNKRRLGIIAKWLEAGAPHKKGVDGFNMKYFEEKTPECGTTCCIAGAANQFFGEGTDDFPDIQAQELLDLEWGDAETLFMPFDIDEDEWEKISPAWAARVIRKLIATGEVDWEGTR